MVTSSSYTNLLEKTCLPNPTFQRLAVVSIFQKLKSFPPHLDGGLDTDSGRNALSRCLTSTSPAVVDQSVRELCSLVATGPLNVSGGLIELQAALDACPPGFVDVFVKAIGFVCRHDFQNNRNYSISPQLHPFVKVLSCRPEVCDELKHQVLLFIVQCVQHGITVVSDFLQPFLLFTILKSTSSVHLALFSRDLISSIAALSCSLPNHAISIIRLLIRCLQFSPNGNEKEFKHLLNSTHYLVDAFIVVTNKLGKTEELGTDAKKCCVELLEIIFEICSDLHKSYIGGEVVADLSKSLLLACKKLGWEYFPEFVLVVLSSSIVLTQLEFQHEQLSLLKLLVCLMEWKNETCVSRGDTFCFFEESLLVLPVTNLLSSPSKSVKATATYLLSMLERHLLDILVAPEKVQFSQIDVACPSKTISIIRRLLHHLWFPDQFSTSSLYFIEMSSDKELLPPGKNENLTSWICQLREYSILNIDSFEFKRNFGSQRSILPGMPYLLCTIVSFLVTHPKFGSCAVDSFSSVCLMDPKVSLPLLLTVLFYCKIFCNSKNASQDLLIKLLEVLPSLASHSFLMPLVVQTILPMLHQNTNPVLYATAVRLLCKTWVVADQCFGSLQGILDPKTLAEFISERDISISIAYSLCDVCKHNPDRGVDLILSVSSCIESKDSLLQALGLESLTYLCEADTVDFYTAWNVVIHHLLDYTTEHVVAHSLCILLRWGAMDAESYPEDSTKIIEILWKVGTSSDKNHGPVWLKARVSAFNSLVHYEVGFFQKNIANFKERNMEFFIHEANCEVLNAFEQLEANIINFEHMTRRRLLKGKKIIVNKVEKLLNIFPRAIFPSGQFNCSKELPGATLFVFTPKELKNKFTSKDIPKINGIFENKLLEIAESLQLSRNIFLALLAIQSWKAFVSNWMNSVSNFLDPDSCSRDRSSNVAMNILKIMCKAAENCVPQVAENIALAIGALCMVVQPSSVAFTASTFLQKWLMEYEHEHRQWSAAISLGLLSNCLHVTDRSQKYDVITGLLKVLCSSESYLVKGASGVGLGFACQNLLTRIEVDDDSKFGATWIAEATLLGKIVRSLSLAIINICPSSYDSLKNLGDSFPSAMDYIGAEENAEWLFRNLDNIDEDVWGVAGLVIGLGDSTVAIHRFGATDVVLKIKDLLISWVPLVGLSVVNFPLFDEMAENSLSVGSCIVLPTVLALCQRAELINNNMDSLFNGYSTLISELLSEKLSGSFQQSLLMASCIGAGSFLSYILSDGVHPLKVDAVKHILEVMRSIYTCAYPPVFQFYGMLGVVNAFGAGAGLLTKPFSQPLSFESNYIQKESTYISVPILRSHALEAFCTTVVQEMFIIAKDHTDRQRQRFAAWGISFLWDRWWAKDYQDVIGSQGGGVNAQSVSQSFSDDSLVWKLYLWLLQLQSSEIGVTTHVSTVATVLACLRQAPRLPASSDWGPIIRRCMSYTAVQLTGDPLLMEPCRVLREECMNLSLAHANIEPFMVFLDQQADLAKFRALELNLQLALLNQLPRLLKVFSAWRWEKLCNDLVEYFTFSTSPYSIYETHQKMSMRVSFWKGLSQCLNETYNNSVYTRSIEKCMETLFSLFPALTSTSNSRGRLSSVKEEWSVAVHCFSNADIGWLMDTLKVTTDVDQEHGRCLSFEVMKRIFSITKLVMKKHIPVYELGKLKALILSTRSEGTWNILVEVAGVVGHEEGSIKRQWLIDAVDISTVSEYPSTALQFIGILSGRWCAYMPLLILDPIAVLSDLPVTLPSLMEDRSWSVILQDLVAKLLMSAERLCSWASKLHGGDDSAVGLEDNLKEDESILLLLSSVMHKTCVSLKRYMSFEEQLRLANMQVINS